MAIRIRKRKVMGGWYYVGICATDSKPEKGDIYLDDGIHEALSKKFYNDFVKMGFIKNLK